MQSVHYELWRRCTAFVAAACASRDASHGLAHMRNVTQQAMLLYFMDASGTVPPPEQAGVLYRLILVGMLHDVADHKYDHDGTLQARVDAFLTSEAKALVQHAAAASPHEFRVPLPRNGDDGGAVSVPRVVELMATALDAISYSKEVKRGMRWFVPALCDGLAEAAHPSSSWTAVRDYVSDADKLEAIGEEGLLRCYEYTCERFRAASLARRRAAATEPCAPSSEVERQLETAMLHDVSEHFHEKLKRLLPLFIVTPAGKFAGAPLAEEMAALLTEWQAEGPPPVTLFWRNAAAEYTPA